MSQAPLGKWIPPAQELTHRTATVMLVNHVINALYDTARGTIDHVWGERHSVGQSLGTEGIPWICNPSKLPGEQGYVGRLPGVGGIL